jgi:hypothetical protein
LIEPLQLFDGLKGMVQDTAFWLQKANDMLQRGLGSNLPSLIQNLGLALLTILIPLAIVILTDFYQKKGKEDKSLSELDLRVILDTVFQVKRIVFYSILVFSPFVFWDISYGFIRLFETVLSLIGIALILKTILKIYHWTKGNVAIYRVSYLKALEDPTDLRVAWRSIWQSNEIGYRNEVDLFDIFSSKIDEIVKHYEKKP